MLLLLSSIIHSSVRHSSIYLALYPSDIYYQTDPGPDTGEAAVRELTKALHGPSDSWSTRLPQACPKYLQAGVQMAAAGPQLTPFSS